MDKESGVITATQCPHKCEFPGQVGTIAALLQERKENEDKIWIKIDDIFKKLDSLTWKMALIFGGIIAVFNYVLPYITTFTEH